MRHVSQNFSQFGTDGVGAYWGGRAAEIQNYPCFYLYNFELQLSLNFRQAEGKPRFKIIHVFICVNLNLAGAAERRSSGAVERRRSKIIHVFICIILNLCRSAAPASPPPRSFQIGKSFATHAARRWGDPPPPSSSLTFPKHCGYSIYSVCRKYAGSRVLSPNRRKSALKLRLQRRARSRANWT